MPRLNQAVLLDWSTCTASFSLRTAVSYSFCRPASTPSFMRAIDLLRSSKQPLDASATRSIQWVRMGPDCRSCGLDCRLLLAFAARRLEDERVGDDDDAAALRLRELPATDGAGDALVDRRIVHRRLLHDGGDHLPRAGDGELDDHAAVQIGLLGQLLLVAELHFVDVAPDDAADDLLVERAAHLRGAGDDVRRVGATAAEAAGAAAVAGAGAAAAALADGAEVAEADRAFAGAAAAAPGADQAEAADAVRFADLRADEAAEHVLGVVAERRVAPEDGRQVRALFALEDAEHAGVLRLLLGEHLGEVRIGVVLGTLQGVETRLVLRSLLAHLAFFALVTLALAARLVGTLLLEPLGDLLLLLLGRLDQELGEALV